MKNTNLDSEFQIIHKSELKYLLCAIAFFVLISAFSQAVIAIKSEASHKAHIERLDAEIAELHKHQLTNVPAVPHVKSYEEAMPEFAENAKSREGKR